jgi:hypothetical protein
MGAMERIGRAGVVALALAFLLTMLVPMMPSGAANPALPSGGNGPLAEQYDPTKLFEPNVVFGDHSYVKAVDPWARDFAIGDLNDDGLEDLAMISNATNEVCIYNRSDDGSDQ